VSERRPRTQGEIRVARAERRVLQAARSWYAADRRAAEAFTAARADPIAIASTSREDARARDRLRAEVARLIDAIIDE